MAQHGGYSSEFAFAKAFKREFGVPPGSYRRAFADHAAPTRGARGNPPAAEASQ